MKNSEIRQLQKRKGKALIAAKEKKAEEEKKLAKLEEICKPRLKVLFRYENEEDIYELSIFGFDGIELVEAVLGFCCLEEGKTR